AAKIGRRFTHLICLTIGGLGLISLFFIQDREMLLVPMVAVGLAWASTLTMPYAMLADALPANKMGFYMGVFNIFVVVPQLVAALILGFFVQQVFEGQSIYALVVGGISMVIAGFLNLIIREKREDEPTEIIEEIMTVDQRPI
ncbi:MAG TPA: MFS transporter, partial [Flavisolibacter sp.]|nr:MFS transporter [Flavisolibacter sp.]